MAITPSPLREIILLILILLLIPNIAAGLACPQHCVCQWRNGLPTADCSNLNLTSIPNNIPSNVLVLDLSGNQIRHIANATFLRQNLAHLIKLDLSHCEIETIEPAALTGMTNLRELHLDGNNFDKVPHGIFEATASLRLLSLRFNLLNTIPRQVFAALKQLETLDLSSSQINHIDQRGFEGLTNLRSLQLNGNRLSRLTVPTVSSLKSLQQLDLHNNNWNCDCRVRDLSLWMHQGKVGSGFRPTCATPLKFQHAVWDAIPTKELVCAPEILAIEAFDILPGQNISIECAVFGDPLPTVQWYYQDTAVDFVVNATKYENHIQNLSSHLVHILIIRNASEVDGGNYQCRASNSVGNVTGMMPLFQSNLLLTPSEIVILLIALLVGLTLVVGFFFYCGKYRQRAIPLTKLWTKEKLPSLNSTDKFQGVTYFRTSDVLAPVNSTATSPVKSEEKSLLLIESEAISVDVPKENTITHSKDNHNRSPDTASPRCRISVENELLGDRITDHEEEDKDSGIQHEEDSSVRNDSSTSNGICTPQDIFTDSDHDSVVKLPATRNLTFSSSTGVNPQRSSLRRSPALSHQSLKVSFLSAGYDTYLGTEV